MKRFFAAICALLALSIIAPAQTRTRRTTKHPPAKTTKTADAEAAAKAAAVRTEGANRIATQIKSLTKFLYLVGGVARGIEAIDISSKGTPSPTNEKNKAQLRASFSDYRVALDALELYFRNTPELQNYYTKLAGSASGAADAESQAAAGQFLQAGNTLVGVVGRLTDVLTVMH